MPDKINKKILILGGGPTGLGAAWRLQECGFKNWDLYEGSHELGGHSGSHTDEKGFTWDEGGHIFFSNIPYYQNLFERLYKGEYVEKKRIQSIFFDGTFIPYPFQNHIRHLPREVMMECLDGVIEATRQPPYANPKNFLEFNANAMGRGINKYFMEPYNRKVWSWPLEEMDYSWIAERVSVIDLKKLVNHVINQEDDLLWGPNAFFQYPKRGGSGAFWKKFGSFFPERLHFRKQASRVDLRRKKVFFTDGSIEPYDYLISTLALTDFIAHSNAARAMKKNASSLVCNSGHIISIGIRGAVPRAIGKNVGIYFPDEKLSFHRATVLQNFSPHMAPRGTWSIAFETSFSVRRKVSLEKAFRDVVAFLKKQGWLKRELDIVSIHKKTCKYFYPVPTLGFEEKVAALQRYLLTYDVFSRGRFGSWQYKIGNMDHSFMLGVEAVNHIVTGKEDLFKLYG